MVPGVGFEPTASWTTTTRSNRLSYPGNTVLLNRWVSRVNALDGKKTKVVQSYELRTQSKD